MNATRRARARWGAMVLALAGLVASLVPLLTLPASAASTVTVFYQPNTSWTTVNIHYAPNGGSWTAVPGVAMDTACTGWRKKTIDLGTATGLQVVFNNGSGTWDNNNGANYSLGTGNVTVSGGVTGTGDPCASPSGDPVLVGAGDIADSGSGDTATAALLDGISGTVFTTGDNVYPNGTSTEFANYYDPTWGRHKARTRPAPGNHDYNTSGATGYYNYFGTQAGPSGRGYYSYDLGNWHIVSLNSNVSMSAGSAQEQWLRADLAASGKPCTLAYWHHPLFTSGANHGPSTSTRPLYQALYDYNADVVVWGHNHQYERFAPMNPSGALDNGRGIRSFVAGMGGVSSFYGFGTIQPNSEARNSDTWGVLKFTLHNNSYTWQFVPQSGKTYTDAGTNSCH